MNWPLPGTRSESRAAGQGRTEEGRSGGMGRRYRDHFRLFAIHLFELGRRQLRRQAVEDEFARLQPNDACSVAMDEIEKMQATENGDVVLLVEEFKVCLLYTSPSPRDRTRSRMPSSA